MNANYGKDRICDTGGLVYRSGDAMADEQKYIAIMIESLHKKEALLDSLLVKTEAQSECICEKEYGDIKWDSFNVLIAEKQSALDRLNELDSGFETLYERVKDALQEHKEQYADEVRLMQDLIKKITDKGISIQTAEEKNRSNIERIMGNAKREIRQARTSVKVASNYYKSMNRLTAQESRFVDRKK